MNHLFEITFPYSLPSETLRELENSLISFSEITGVPVTYRNLSGDIAWEYNTKRKVCISNADYYTRGSVCDQRFRSALTVARDLGSIYHFICESGVITLIYAWHIDGRLMGYFSAGPIIMGIDREKVISNFYKKVPVDTIDPVALLNATNLTRIFTPLQVTYVSNLFTNAFAIAPADSGSFNKIQRNVEQNIAVNKIIQLKHDHIEIEYPSASEGDFLRCIDDCDSDSISRKLSKYIEDLMVYEGGDLSVVRIRLIILFTQIITPSTQISDDKILKMEELNTAVTLREMMDISKTIACDIISELRENIYSGPSDIVSHAISYINRNKNNRIQLNTVAEALHVNKSYLSSLFKREMGITITEYINSVHIEKAAELLSKTGKDVTEIALECGFDNPSYFAKLFRDRFNLTPSEFRRGQ